MWTLGRTILLITFLAGSALGQTIDIPAEKPFLPEGKPLAGLVVTLDPGHGGSPHQEGYHGSARGVNSGVVEGDLNMLVAGELRHYLQWAGAVVHVTRWDDRKVTYGPTGREDELGERVKTAGNTRSHLFLALHHNSTGRASADGVVVLIWPTDSQGKNQPLENAFADLLREEVEKQVHHKERFPHYLNKHPLVTDSDIPSAVIEFGFLSNPEFDAWVSQRGTHRAEALGVYNAVVRMWKEQGKELEAKRRELFPDLAEKSSDAPPKPFEIIPPTEVRFDQMIKRFWPVDQLPATEKQAQSILDLYRSITLSDSTFFYLNAEVTKDGNEWAVKGSANHPSVQNAAGNLLKAAGCTPLRNEITLLPSDRLGEKRFGVVQIPMALTWAGPKEGDGVQTQLLLGEPVYLLDVSEDGRYLLLHAGEGYVGWVRREAIRELTAMEFGFWSRTPRAAIAGDVMLDDFRVPAGASLPIVWVDAGSTVTLQLPKAVRGAKGSDQIRLSTRQVALPLEPSVGYRAVMAAKEFMTTPYVYGGKSRLGLDCSGLTSAGYSAAGVVLPRDAFQQVIVGRMVGTPWRKDDLQPGDVLFFVDDTGRIVHTGLSLGGQKFIHCAPPEVQVSSFDRSDPLYSDVWTPAFAFARRPVP